MSGNKFDIRQSVLRPATTMGGTAANATADTVLTSHDSLLQKLFTDRNAQLTDGGLISLNQAGTSLSFTQNLKLVLDSNTAGSAPISISLGSATQTLAAGTMIYAVINRGAGTAVVSTGLTLPAVSSANQEVFLIAKREASADGTIRVYFRNGHALAVGQSIRLGDALARTGDSMSGNLVLNAALATTQAIDNSTTGSGATLAAFTSSYIKLTQGTLVSISTIPAGVSGQVLTLQNGTGNSVSLNNGSALVTGTGANLPLASGATIDLIYDAASSAWSVVGGVGGGSGGATSVVTSTYGPVTSTSNQTVINLSFSVTVSNAANFFVTIDGKTLSYGAGSDYTFTNVTGGASTQITLNQPINSGLNIQAWYLGNAVPATGGSGGSGFKNYLSAYGNIETGSIANFSLFNTTMSAGIPTTAPAAGASSITTFVAESTAPLSGGYSMQVSSSGALTAGQGFITQPFTIDASDQAKVLTFGFNYKVVSGASAMDFSGTFAANTYQVWIYDVTNAAWVQPAGSCAMTQTSGVGSAVGTFQTAANGSQYRLALLCAHSSTGATNLYFDDFSAGPQSIPIGAAVSDWTPYTVSLTTWGSGAIAQAFWRRVGDSMEIMANVGSGASPSGVTTFPLPPGISVDNSNTKISNTNYTIIGSMLQDKQASTVEPIIIGGATYISFGVYVGTGTAGSTPTAVVPANANSHFTVKFPVQGWSSNVQSSSDSDTRVVATRYTATPGAGVNTAFGATVVNFDSLDFDTHAAVTTGSSWKFTAPMSGVYDVSSFVGCTNTGNTGLVRSSLQVFKNGVYHSESTSLKGNSTSTGSSISVLVKMVAGEFVDLRYSVDGGGASNITAAFVAIKRLSGPSVIAASESVNASYKLSADTSVGATSPVPFTVKIKDTHNSFNTTSKIYTIPVSGEYRFSVIGQASVGTNFYILKNGVGAGYMFTSQAGIIASGTNTLPFIAGDTLTFYIDNAALIYASSGGGPITQFSIERVGN
jgi:hypothetical protein